MNDDEILTEIEKAFKGYDGCCNCYDCRAKREKLRELQPIAMERGIPHPWSWIQSKPVVVVEDKK
jgi:hypothetical protein